MSYVDDILQVTPLKSFENLNTAITAMRKLDAADLLELNKALRDRYKEIQRHGNAVKAEVKVAQDGLKIGDIVTFTHGHRRPRRVLIKTNGFNRARTHFTGFECVEDGTLITGIGKWTVPIALCRKVKDGEVETRPATPAGFDDTNNCTVHALASAAGISFEKADIIATRAGRQKNKGMISQYLIDYVSREEGLKFEKLIMVPMTLSDFVRKYRVGRFYIRKNRHAFAIVNGQILDNRRSTGMNTVVKAAWKFMGA